MAEVVRTVSDGCIAHVSMKLDTAEVRAAHDDEYYKVIEKIGSGKYKGRALDELVMRNQELHDSIDGARDKIMELVKIGMRTLLSMERLSEMYDADSKLELRLLLCRVKSQ